MTPGSESTGRAATAAGSVGEGSPALLLADRYRLDSLIAAGGMGEVWRAEDVLLARPVAVKTLRPEFTGDEEFRRRFRAEARHAAGLSHPGIASVYDFGESAERAWLVMELVDGEPLSAVLAREGRLSPERTLDVLAQTAAALQVAHDAGVVHRDIKPGNLLLRPDGTVKVTDFGIASAGDSGAMTQVGRVVGTAFYLSPEQASGRGAVPASDLYSLGVVAHEALAGSRPFSADTPVAVLLSHLHDPPPPLPDSVPAPVQQLVGRLLAKDPAARPASGAELSAAAAAVKAQLTSGPTTRVLPRVPARDAPPAGQGHRSLGAPLAAAAGGLVRPTPGRTGSARAGSAHGRGGPPPQPHRRAVRAAAVLLLVLALVLGVRALATDPPATTPRPPGGSTGPAPVVVDAAALVGRPAAEVRDRLSADGLVPRLVADGTGGAVGRVSAVEPSGPLAAGTPVVVHVVPPRPAPPAGGEQGDKSKDEGKDDKDDKDDKDEDGKRP